MTSSSTITDSTTQAAPLSPSLEAQALKIERAIKQIELRRTKYDGATSFLVWHSSNHQPTHKIEGVTYIEFADDEVQVIAKRFYQKVLHEKCVGKTVYYINDEYSHDLHGKETPIAYSILERDKVLLMKGAKRISTNMTDEALSLLNNLNRVTFS